MQMKPKDEISRDALFLFPLVKRLFNGDPRNPALESLRNQSYHILRILEKRGPLPLSAIGRQLFIAKQNMTTFIDRLVREGLVERRNDAADRRVINIAITEDGGRFLKERTAGLQEIVRGNLSKLDAEDIESLRSALLVIKKILPKLG